MTIKEIILHNNPNADTSVVERFGELVEKYNLKYIIHPNGQPLFIGSQLSEAKGLDKDDFRRNYTPNLIKQVGGHYTTSGEKNRTLAQPTYAFLEKENLAKFKFYWNQFTGNSLGRINQLWVCNWYGAYLYLVQGYSEAAQEFGVLGAAAIEQTVKSNLIIQAPSYKGIRPTWQDENLIQEGLANLANFGPVTFKREVSVEDYPQSSKTVRRFDLVRVYGHKTLGKIVEILEIKKGIIDLEVVISTLSAKKYQGLAQERYQTPHVNVIFISPEGATQEAYEYTKNLNNVIIYPLAEYTQILLDKVHWYHKCDPYFIEAVLKKEYPIINKMLTLPQVPQLKAA